MSYLSVALLACLASIAGLWRFYLRGSNGRHPVPSQPPRIGGVAMAGGTLVLALLATQLPIGAAHRPATGLMPVLAGAALVFLIGWIDDRFPLPPLVKLGGQVMAAGLTYVLGLGAGFLPPGPMNALLTIFCLVGGANALNLIDGVDGLAGGVALIAAGAGFLVAREAGQLEAAVLAAALAGATLAFLWFNLPPARVYMGDAGSNFLGFALAAIPLLVSSGPRGLGDFSATMLLLAVPIVETATTIARRLAIGRSPLRRDRRHVHHKLLREGWSIGAVLGLAWGLTLAMGALVLLAQPSWVAPIVRAVAAWTTLGALLLASLLYAGWNAGRLPGSPKR